MATIHYRKPEEPSIKKNWIPANRKYKKMFYISLGFNIVSIIILIFTRLH